MRKTSVSPALAVTAAETVLPGRVQEALGELVGAAKEGLLALSVGVGLGVLAELMEEEVDEVVGPKGRHDPKRTAVRHGHEGGEVTLGGRRLAVERPRVRSADGRSELPLATYAHFAERDPISRVVLQQMLAGVSTRRYRRTQEPVGEAVEADARSTSKSAVSREFVARTREHLEALMQRRLDDVRLAVLMIDGIDLKGRTNVVALGISTDGVKIPLGLWEGSTENAAVATALLSDLVERGLDVEQGVLSVLDGAKALRKAVRDVLGVDTPVQRCIRSHGAQRARPPARARPARCQTAAPLSLEARRSRDRGRPPARAGRRARAQPPRRRCLAARGSGGNAHAATARDPRQPQTDARLHQSLRVDDRVRPPHQPQRQALAIGRHGAPLDRRRHARSRTTIPQNHRLPGPREAGTRDRTRPRPHDHPVPDRGNRYPRHCLITNGPPSQNSTTRGTSSGAESRMVKDDACREWVEAAERAGSLDRCNLRRRIDDDFKRWRRRLTH